MKSAAFEYVAPTSLEEAIALLAARGDEAKVIAGGQSLMPLLALRFAQPGLLVDLNRVAGLAGIRELPGGGLAIGAMTRTRELETDPLVAARAPLAAEAAPLIAHRAIRNRGTVGGAVAHADAAAELPAVMVASGATIVAQGPSGSREIAAAEFFETHYTTALATDEVLTELRLPPLPAGSGTAFEEISRRHGDFAMAGAATVLSLDDGGRCSAASVVLLGVADRPVAVDTDALLGAPPERERFAAVAEAAAAQLSPASDQHASAEYRRHLAAVLVTRTLTSAADRAS